MKTPDQAPSFPERIFVQDHNADFLRMQRLGKEHEWVHLSEHEHIVATQERDFLKNNEVVRELVRMINLTIESGGLLLQSEMEEIKNILARYRSAVCEKDGD